MANLVLCPTCGARMSVNARTCPACGETDFFERRCEPGIFHSTCPICNGTGRGWKYTFRNGCEYNPKFPPQKGDAVLRFPEFYNNKPVIFRNAITDSAVKHTLIQAIDSHLYKIEAIGYQNFELHFDRVKCTACKGEGKIAEEIDRLVLIDRRKPA